MGLSKTELNSGYRCCDQRQQNSHGAEAEPYLHVHRVGYLNGWLANEQQLRLLRRE